MGDKDRQVSRRGFFGSLLRDTAKLARTINSERGTKDELDSMLTDFESLPIASTYPWELFEDEAKRMGIDYEKIGKVEAIKRIIAYQMKQNSPDAQGDVVQPQFDSLVHLDPVTEITPFSLGIPRRDTKVIGEKTIRNKGNQREMLGDLGWYLWFEDKPGAYLLELVEAESRKTENGCDASSLLSGYFRVKYYPDISDDEIFETFSFSEQAARMSRLFDKSGTPVFEAESEMNESLFVTGRLDVSRSPTGDFVELVLSAPDRWVTSHSRGLRIRVGGGRIQRW